MEVLSSWFKNSIEDFALLILYPENSSALMAMAKGSMAKMNNSGERGHPRRVYLSTVNGLDKLLLVITCAVGLVYNNSIHFRNLIPILIE